MVVVGSFVLAFPIFAFFLMGKDEEGKMKGGRGGGGKGRGVEGRVVVLWWWNVA